MNEDRFVFLHPDFSLYSLAERLWTSHITFHSLRELFGQKLWRNYKIWAAYRKPEYMQHTFLSLNKSVPQNISVPIMWLTLGQQIFPCLPIAICLSFFSYSFHSLFQTYVATYVPRKESLNYPLHVWWNGRLNGARESTISSYSHFCFLLTSSSPKFIPPMQGDVEL